MGNPNNRGYGYGAGLNGYSGRLYRIFRPGQTHAHIFCFCCSQGQLNQKTLEIGEKKATHSRKTDTVIGYGGSKGPERIRIQLRGEPKNTDTDTGKAQKYGYGYGETPHNRSWIFWDSWMFH